MYCLIVQQSFHPVQHGLVLQPLQKGMPYPLRGALGCALTGLCLNLPDYEQPYLILG